MTAREFFARQEGTAGGGSSSRRSTVIGQGIWACQEFSGGSVPDLSKLQDPRTLGYLLIRGFYSKPIACCQTLLLLGTLQRAGI